MLNTPLDSQIALLLHVLFFVAGLLYLVFAVMLYFHIKTLEKWLASLKRYDFKKWALAHLIMSAIGVVVLLVLFI